MRHSGTFHLSPNANNNAQLVYCSLHDKCLVGMYLQLDFIGGKPVKGAINLINYSNSDVFQIKKATLDWSLKDVSGQFVFAKNPIKCISLLFEIENTKESSDETQNTYTSYSLDPKSIIGDYTEIQTFESAPNAGIVYLEVKSFEDELGDLIEDSSFELTDKCKDVKKSHDNLAAPGRICPRGYS